MLTGGSLRAALNWRFLGTLLTVLLSVKRFLMSRLFLEVRPPLSLMMAWPLPLPSHQAGEGPVSWLKTAAWPLGHGSF